MIDIGQKLRKAYFNVLSGHLFYNGSPVPVVDEKIESNIAENELYVMFMTQNEQNMNTKTYWGRECELVVTIVNHRLATNTKEAVENVSTQILELLFPSRNSNALNLESPLKLSLAYLTNAEYNPLTKTDTGFFVSKVLVFKNRVIQ